MFGTPRQTNGHAARQSASDVAEMQGGGLVLVVVTETAPLSYSLFLNGKPVPELDVESLSVSVEAPEGGDSLVRATLARYVTDVSGQRSLKHQELFPCTIELIVAGRRLIVTCEDADSIDSVWIALGLQPDGSGRKVTGAKALRLLLTEELLDVKLTWVDGETEDLLPPV